MPEPKNSLQGLKKSIVQQLERVMEEKGITQPMLAKRMKRTRMVVYRLLNLEYENITLDTLICAANALDIVLEVNFS